MATTPEDQLKFLNHVHDAAMELLRGVEFDKRPRKDGYVVCLYASMIELAGGVALLIEKDRKTSLSPVFRTLIEAYVDFRNAVTDEGYINHSFARHHKDWIKVLKHGESNNPYLAGIHAHEERDTALERHTSELMKLKEQGVSPLKVDERFARAEMTEVYLSVYHFESDAIHNSWSAIIGRHFEEAGDDFSLTLYREHELGDYEAYMDGTAAILLDATKAIHERLKTGKQKEIEELEAQLKALRDGRAPS